MTSNVRLRDVGATCMARPASQVPSSAAEAQRGRLGGMSKSPAIWRAAFLLGLSIALTGCSVGAAPTPQIVYVTPAPTPTPTPSPTPAPWSTEFETKVCGLIVELPETVKKYRKAVERRVAIRDWSSVYLQSTEAMDELNRLNDEVPRASWAPAKPLTAALTHSALGHLAPFGIYAVSGRFRMITVKVEMDLEVQFATLNRDYLTAVRDEMARLKLAYGFSCPVIP